MEERGVKVDDSTLNHWVIYYTPKLEKAFHIKKGKLGDRQGNTIDLLLTAKRDKRAALRFITKAIGRNGKSGANKAGIKVYNSENGRRAKIRQCKYLNNIVEQVVRQSDHRRIKRISHSMLGFKNFRSAQATLTGVRHQE